MKTNYTIATAALLGASAVAIGAFGAHTFAAYLAETGRAETFETAVRYQFYHTLAMFLVGLLQQQDNQSKWLRWSAYSFLAGILIFCGSLYTICITNKGVFGAVAPIGGLLFIFAWLGVVAGVIKAKNKQQPIGFK